MGDDNLSDDHWRDLFIHPGGHAIGWFDLFDPVGSMTIKPVFKCSKKKKLACDSLAKYSSTQYGSGRRIFITETVNLKTRKSGIGVCYQYGPKSKKSPGKVWLNFCPWCGGAW